MNKFRNLLVSVCLILGIVLILSCKKDPTLANLKTITPTDITLTSVTSGGEITNSGGVDITARGVCWSTSQNPIISGSHTSNGLGSGTFSSPISGLTPDTKYYIRAYATNSVGTAYGNEVSSKTAAMTAPVLTTVELSQITLTSYSSGGTITSDGGAPVTAKGVCWSTQSNPTTADNKTSDGTGTASFTSSLSELTQGTTYHVRAYATNSIGTGYGNELVFTTTAVAPAVLSTTAISMLTSNTARSGGNITSAGGGNISARGVCWSTSANPTIDDPKSLDGTGTGTFSSDLTGLTENTFYYFRAYATNEAGTAYGNELTFTASPIQPPTVTTTSATAITATSANSGGEITDAGNGTITGRGVCWGTTAAPTLSDSHTTDEPGSGSFTSSITGLSGSTTYYLRAYATNYAGTSYGTETTFKTYAATDADGNNYTSVVIGAQTWLVENLKSTRYNNGDLIGTTIPMTLDLTTAVTPKYQWPCGGDEAYVAEYGRFYTYHTVIDSRGICPTGWHLPSDPEWEIMKGSLGGEIPAGGMVKEAGTTHWKTPNTGATNESGFTALPGGYRGVSGAFISLTLTGYFWSSSLNPTPDWAWGQGLHYDDARLLRGGYWRNDGASVRCLKDQR